MSPTAVQTTLAEMARKADSGEPEEGVYICGRCGRNDCRMYTVRNPHPGRVTKGSWYDWGSVASHDPGEFIGMLLCPCCSFPKLSGCPHPVRAD